MQILIFALIGLAALALLVYLFSFLGKKELNSDPKRVEELWVRAHGDAAMVKMYYKAHTDEERAQIVSFIHSTCPQEPGPNASPAPGRQPMFFGGPAQMEETAEIKGKQAEAPLFGDLDEEETEELPLSRKERKAQRQQEKADKAAAKAAAKEAALAAAIAEANKVRVSQGNSGEQQEYADLESALSAAIAQVDSDAAQQMQPAPEAVAEQIGDLPSSPVQEPAKLCPVCGAEVLPGCQFCIICGQPLGQPEAAAAESPVPVDDVQVQAEQSGTCPACGAETLANNQFCIICGQPLTQPNDKPQAQEAAPVVPVQEEIPAPVEEIPQSPEAAPVAPVQEEIPAPVEDESEFLTYAIDEPASHSGIEMPQPVEILPGLLAYEVAAPTPAAEEAPIKEKKNEEQEEESSAQQQSQAYQQMQNEFRSIEEGLSASAAALSAEIEAMRATMDTWRFSEREETIPAQPAEELEAAPAPSDNEATSQSSAPAANKDYSATLGLSGALSLEEILRNVQELEKRINKGSDIEDEE